MLCRAYTYNKKTQAELEFLVVGVWRFGVVGVYLTVPDGNKPAAPLLLTTDDRARRHYHHHHRKSNNAKEDEEGNGERRRTYRMRPSVMRSLRVRSHSRTGVPENERASERVGQ